MKERLIMSRYLNKGEHLGTYSISIVHISNLKDMRRFNDVKSEIFDMTHINLYWLDYFIDNSKSIRNYIISKEEKIVGIYSLRVKGNESYLFNLGVLQEYQGLGIGRETLTYIIDNSIKEGRSIISLRVRSTNTSAIKLYKSMGFQIENR